MSGSTHTPLRIGLTGGIASGKSVVADCFAAHGITVIDTDVIAREVVEPGTPGLAALLSEFGETILTDDGTLDRAGLRKIVFTDAAARRQLEAILHPLIREETVAQSAQRAAASPYQIIAVPLLIESGFIELVDRVLVVDCEEHTQLARLQARDGVSAADAAAALNSQLGRAARLNHADDVLENNGTLADLEARVDALHHRYLELAEQST